ncbi:hypothetical protein BRADI_3g55436v3 [Brachypodium distachyon]|uniref:Uncharacterized protein n=1 Tax=Brachypodium distachyon TaxID=15368 RepID=A0A0Q3I6A8_BRADI|nr:hypothetical protein BRADI_3g55436v3 [Brachypodium distachyon]
MPNSDQQAALLAAGFEQLVPALCIRMWTDVEFWTRGASSPMMALLTGTRRLTWRAVIGSGDSLGPRSRGSG